MGEYATLSEEQIQRAIEDLKAAFPGQAITDNQRQDFEAFFATLRVGEWPKIRPLAVEFSGKERNGFRPNPADFVQLRDGHRALVRRERELASTRKYAFPEPPTEEEREFHRGHLSLARAALDACPKVPKKKALATTQIGDK